MLSRSYVFTLIVSSLIPITASYVDDHAPSYLWGIIDVCLAITCFTIFLILFFKTKKNELSKEVFTHSYRLIEMVSSVSLFLIFIFMTKLIKLNWMILTIGLGWRYYLLVISLPYVVHHWPNKQ